MARIANSKPDDVKTDSENGRWTEKERDGAKRLIEEKREECVERKRRRSERVREGRENAKAKGNSYVVVLDEFSTRLSLWRELCSRKLVIVEDVRLTGLESASHGMTTPTGVPCFSRLTGHRRECLTGYPMFHRTPSILRDEDNLVPTTDCTTGDIG